jgi:hypothetical protein
MYRPTSVGSSARVIRSRPAAHGGAATSPDFDAGLSQPANPAAHRRNSKPAACHACARSGTSHHTICNIVAQTRGKPTDLLHRGPYLGEGESVKKSSKPARMITAGVVTALVGWMARNSAASRMEEALRIAAIRDPKGGPSVESAISLGYIGLGMIIFGVALFLVGLVVMARRR